jgi:stress response protein SCP2
VERRGGAARWSDAVERPGTFGAVASTIEMTPGQDLLLSGADRSALTRLRLGLAWAKIPTAGAIGTGAPDVDLDASAVQFSGGQLFDLAFYNNLRTRDGSVVHLGDNQTGRGEGDDEVLTVDLARVYAKVDAIVFMISSYQGHTLEWVNRASVRLVDAAAAEGAGHELARFTLTGGVPHTGMAMAKLYRDSADPDRWRLQAIGEGIAATVPTESVAALQRFL